MLELYKFHFLFFYNLIIFTKLLDDIMIKVAVTGAAGRMGSGIIRKITEQDDMEVVAAIEMPNTPLAGVDAGEKAGIGNIGVPIVGSQDLEKALKESGAELKELLNVA